MLIFFKNILTGITKHIHKSAMLLLTMAVFGAVFVVFPASIISIEKTSGPLFTVLKPAIISVFGVGLAFCMMFQTLNARTISRIKLRAFDIFLAVFLLFSTFSWILNGAVISFGSDWIALIGTLLIPIYGVCLLDSKNQERFLLHILVFSAFLVAVITIAESAGLKMPWELSAKPVATLGSRSIVASFLSTIIPLAIYQIFSTPLSFKRPEPRLIYSIIVATTVLLAVILCRSRASWLSLFIGLFFYLIFAGRALLKSSRLRLVVKRSLVFATSTAAAVSTVLFVIMHFSNWSGLAWNDETPYQSSLVRIFDYEGGTGEERVAQFRIGTAMLKDHLTLGVGPGNWRQYAPNYAKNTVDGSYAFFTERYLSPDSDWLRLLIEHGIPAGSAFMFMIATVLVLPATRRCTTEPESSNEIFYLIALKSALLVLVCVSFFDIAFFRSQSTLAVGIVIGILRLRQLPLIYFTGRRYFYLFTSVYVIISIAFFCISSLRSVAIIHYEAGGASLESLKDAERYYPLPHVLYRHFRMSGPSSNTCLKEQESLSRLLLLFPFDYALHDIAAACAFTRGDSEQAQFHNYRAMQLGPERGN